MAKYKVNQCVRIVFQPGVHVFHIFEITEITCTAGTQTIYKGRINGINGDGLHYHSPKDLLIVREEEITGTSSQSVIWDELARLQAEKDKKK